MSSSPPDPSRYAMSLRGEKAGSSFADPPFLDRFKFSVEMRDIGIRPTTHEGPPPPAFRDTVRTCSGSDSTRSSGPLSVQRVPGAQPSAPPLSLDLLNPSSLLAPLLMAFYYEK